MILRISRPDVHNWIVEGWSEPSEIKTGPKKGEMSKGGWKVLGYYGTLKSAAVAMLDKGAGEAVREGRPILEAIEQAERNVISMLEAVRT